MILNHRPNLVREVGPVHCKAVAMVVNNLELLLALMRNEGSSQLLRMRIDEGAQLRQNGQPNVFGSDLEMTVLAVSLERRVDEPIVSWLEGRTRAVLERALYQSRAGVACYQQVQDALGRAWFFGIQRMAIGEMWSWINGYAGFVHAALERPNRLLELCRILAWIVVDVEAVMFPNIGSGSG